MHIIIRTFIGHFTLMYACASSVENTRNISISNIVACYTFVCCLSMNRVCYKFANVIFLSQEYCNLFAPGF